MLQQRHRSGLESGRGQAALKVNRKWGGESGSESGEGKIWKVIGKWGVGKLWNWIEKWGGGGGGRRCKKRLEIGWGLQGGLESGGMLDQNWPEKSSFGSSWSTCLEIKLNSWTFSDVTQVINLRNKVAMEGPWRSHNKSLDKINHFGLFILYVVSFFVFVFVWSTL